MCLFALSLILAFFNVVFSGTKSSSAQGELTQILNISKSYPSWDGRLFSVSTASPVTNAIRANDADDRKFRRAFDLFDGLSSEAVRRRTENDSRACNVPLSVKWTIRARQKLPIFQIGFINLECFTRVDIMSAVRENLLQSSYSQGVRNIIRDARNAIDNATRRVDFYKDGNWSNPDAPFGMNTRTYIYERQICISDTLFAYRVNGSWYVRAAATNHAVYKNMPDPQRQYIYEFVPRAGTSALQMVHPSRETGELELSTTISSAFSGTGYSVETLEFDEMDMPLSMAYNENVIAIDIASDAVTPSNIAILALPMAMSLIPVAFVADLNTIGMFAYILVTDVFSTIPFLIKGVELFQSSVLRKTTMMYYHGGNDTIGNSQVYVIDCRGEGVFRNTGIIFIAIALTAMVTGILMEIFARRMMRKRRLTTTKGDPGHGPFGPFGPAVYRKTSHGLLGREETSTEQEFWERRQACGK